MISVTAKSKKEGYRMPKGDNPALCSVQKTFV
jgi:hypothetical protein